MLSWFPSNLTGHTLSFPRYFCSSLLLGLQACMFSILTSNHFMKKRNKKNLSTTIQHAAQCHILTLFGTHVFCALLHPCSWTIAEITDLNWSHSTKSYWNHVSFVSVTARVAEPFENFSMII